MRLFIAFSALLCCGVAHAQLKQIPFARQGSYSQSKTSQLSTSSTVFKGDTIPMHLPFWDDFSFNNSSKGYASDTIWQFGHSVWVNTGMGINPPTLKVATFDGIDSLGTPYNVNLALAKGIADKLTSRPIRMDEVDTALHKEVYMLFYYQMKGRGELPDPNDEFSLWFKSKDATWNKVWSVQYDTLKSDTVFYPVKLYIKDICDTCYWTNNFQFRFQNFARLSGPFDTWNLDYVYISNGKPQYGVFIPGFPDRALAAPITSLVQQYQSIPVKHFLSKLDTVIGKPVISLTNQRTDYTGNLGQPGKLLVTLTTTKRINKVVQPPVTSTLDTISFKPGGIASDHPNFWPMSLPDFSTLQQNIDSLAFRYFIQIDSGDYIIKPTDPNLPGAWDTTAFKGIHFWYNDSSTTNFVFNNYYAYDDGEAEYAATLTGAGNSLAYQFDMMYRKPDTLVAVDIYFPHAGDESSQVLQLQVFDNQILDANNNNPIILTQQDLVVRRTENNQFIRAPLEEPVVVTTKFFIGYKQSTNNYVPVGLDKNSDSGNKIFTNLGTGWEQSTLKGNLMIRPVFGTTTKAKGPLTGVEEKNAAFYPNPNRGSFYLKQAVQQIQVLDVAGRPVSFVQEDSFESTHISLHNPSPGIYLVRYFSDSQWRTGKLMVLP